MMVAVVLHQIKSEDSISSRYLFSLSDGNVNHNPNLS
jgi:hypothetical protein